MYFLILLLPVLALCLSRLHARSRKAGGGSMLDFSVDRLVPVRGILALLIVLHHFSQVYAAQWPLLTPFLGFGMPVVSVFFFISGYGLCRSLQRKGPDYLAGFLRHRSVRLLPPLLIVMAASWTLRVCVYKSADLAFLVHGLAFLKLNTPSTWFMIPLLFAYLAFYISARACRGRVMPTGIGLALFIAALTAVLLAAGFPDYWICSTPAIPVGYFVAACENPRPLTSASRISAATAVLFILAVAMAYMAQSLPIMYIPRNIAIAVIVYMSVRTGGSLSWSPVRAMGRYSLEIFLTHGLWVEAVRRYAFDAAPAAAIVIGGTAVSAILLHRADTAIARRLASQADNMSAPAPTA